MRARIILEYDTGREYLDIKIVYICPELLSKGTIYYRPPRHKSCWQIVTASYRYTSRMTISSKKIKLYKAPSEIESKLYSSKGIYGTSGTKKVKLFLKTLALALDANNIKPSLIKKTNISDYENIKHKLVIL